MGDDGDSRSVVMYDKQTNVYWALAAFNKGWITQTYDIAQHIHNTIHRVSKNIHSYYWL